MRSLEFLKNVDAVICEDSRITGKLLNHYQIKKQMFVLNDYNEYKMYPIVLKKLTSGQNLALVSDAGTPLISDPGFKLVRECIKQNIPIDGLPGPSSVITALTLSGLPPDKFMFLGFLPDKPGHRQSLYQNIQSISQIIHPTFILFVSPYKITKTLEEMRDFFGDISIVLAKELTKMYQNVQTKSIDDWLDHFKKTKPKGEYVLLFRFD